MTLIKLNVCKIVIINIFNAFLFHLLTSNVLLCICFYTDTSDILNTALDEHNLLKLLADIDDRWYVIGLALNVSNNVLSSLQTSHEENKVKLFHVFHTWLTTQPSAVTWETVISAIEGNVVGNLAKANEIRDHLGLPR